jgi:hypothetical protein
MAMNFNVEPYYDDFDETKKFYKTLFRPGYAVQTRELNQIQSTLQNQVNGVGKHLFKEGSVVIPGNVMYDNNFPYVKLQLLNSSSVNTNSLLELLPKTIIVGQTSGVSAIVLHVEPSTAIDPPTIFVRYISSGATDTIFVDSESLISEDSVQLLVATSNATGTGSIAALSDGIYYINGYFVNVYYKFVTVAKYVNNGSAREDQPTVKLGIVWSESIVTSSEDESLLDNAQGTPNYSAPGADRYKIDTDFQVVSFTTPPLHFVELISINEGLSTISQNQPNYNEIEKELARRTYKESGNYAVNDFKVKVREERTNILGTWTASTAYLIGDIIENTTSGVIYNYKCITAGTSGSSIPALVPEYVHIADGSVSWEFVETYYTNDGLYDVADDSKYIVEISGGTAFVQGYEYSSNGLLRLTNDKARDFNRVNSAAISVTDGSYITIKNVFSIPSTLGSDFVSVDLYNQYTGTPGTSAGTKVGTAYARWLEHDSGTANYRLYIYDITMTNSYTLERDCKQVYFNNVSGNDFTCDVVPNDVKITGSITAAGTTVTGIGTLFAVDLKVGDYITVDSTNYFRVATIPNNNSITIGTSLTTTGSIVYKALSNHNNNTNSALVSLPHAYTRKVKSTDDATIDTQYTITRSLGIITSNGSGRVDMILTNPIEAFAPTSNATNYLFVNNSSGAIQTPTSYTINSAVSVYANGLSNSTSYTVYASVIKTATQRMKTLNTATLDFTTSATAKAALISLGKSDCYKILSVKQSPAFGTITTGNLATLDVSKLFVFNNGQKSLFYDLGSITRTNKQIEITGSIRVVFDYFSHSVGDYFNVDSYENVVPYNDIDTVSRDTLDFRPAKNDNGIGFINANSGILKSGYNISADYSYFIPRVDVIVVTSDKNIKILQGIPGDTASIPIIPDNAMLLYIIGNTPYSSYPSISTILSPIDNRRFTMKDINNLEKRISTLEYYTTLSMVEQSTNNFAITDGLGNDMYKNGFLIESFNEHGVGDVENYDYSCYINSSTKQLYPLISEKSITLTETNTNNSQRTINNYVINDGLITLPFTEVAYSTNIYASRVENVNPFAITSFAGNLSLYPSSDTWFDTLTLPTIQRTLG